MIDMNSAGADKAVSSAISLPQWMKTKISDRYDWDQAAFSPPSEGDGFFFIPYPVSSESKPEAKLNIESARNMEPNYLTEITPETRMKRSATIPEHQFKLNAEESSSRSMVSVAQHMLTGRVFGNYLSATNQPPQDPTYHRQRRNSKSLPASPLSSPKIHRKNPYFTDPFARPNETFEPGKSGWIMSILSQRKSIEDLTANAESSASENNSPRIPRHQNFATEPKPKPSELREMNFWSPVSM